jgi:ABC-type lipoprotein release transport system permease subunit
VLHDLFGRIPFPRDPPLNTLPPAPTVIAEPSPSADQGQVHSIFVPTDGTTSAIERVRTQAILAAPYGLARTSQDWAAARQAGATAGGATIFQLAMLFVMIVAACSLTVSVVATMVERRRPFALLRASGMPLGQLRRLALFETSIPLVVTALGGMAVTFVLYLVGNAGAALAEPESPEALLTLPDAAFFASLGGGLLGAIVVSMLSWPAMDAVTRHDNVRFE